ncbi:hypothetical protein B0A48_17125 [Cryoendolithus antarcticus]|uniref:Distal membrane-arm assembly complex protein 1-like domain-containing protein n=1 Tax=Cryoendolithus antarcticus TaxID=1507870 RepID=A0A1V8SD13_9PEZI|nr:hypothetical protein B0A48_17125 [Cryoendolithus antarcticus]
MPRLTPDQALCDSDLQQRRNPQSSLQSPLLAPSASQPTHPVMAPSLSLPALQQPAPLPSTLSTQRKDYDCTSCRLMGSAAFTSLGVYSHWSGMAQLRAREAEILRSGSRFGMGIRRMGIWGLSGSLVGMGVYRFWV